MYTQYIPVHISHTRVHTCIYQHTCTHRYTEPPWAHTCPHSISDSGAPATCTSAGLPSASPGRGQRSRVRRFFHPLRILGAVLETAWGQPRARCSHVVSLAWWKDEARGEARVLRGAEFSDPSRRAQPCHGDAAGWLGSLPVALSLGP